MEIALQDTIASNHPRDARRLLIDRLRGATLDAAANRFVREWQSRCESVDREQLRCSYQTVRTQFAVVFSRRQIHTLRVFSIWIRARKGAISDIRVCVTSWGLRDDGTYADTQPGVSCSPELA